LGSVALDRIGEAIAAGEAGGARQVLHDDRRIAGDERGEMARHHASRTVVIAARGRSDDDGEAGLGIKARRRLRGGATGEEQARKQEAEPAHAADALPLSHRRLPAFGDAW
jgi:hypothetical protein